MSIAQFRFAVLVSISMGLASAAPADNPPIELDNQTAAGARTQLAPTARPSADWRYRKFNGQWWYFLPNNQWARWDGRQWTIPTPKSSDYQEWRNQQFADRVNDSAAQDDAMRRRQIDRWRAQAGTPASTSFSRDDADYRASVDRFHDNLRTTPYDYRIGTAGHGLFDANPDRTIANSGRLNYATSSGGYMGNALRSPFGY